MNREMDAVAGHGVGRRGKRKHEEDGVVGRRVT
jgi:hypothetical protein